MIALTMLSIIGIGSVFVIDTARRSVAEEVRSSVNMALQLIDAGLAGSQPTQLMETLTRLPSLEKTRHLRIQVRTTPENVIHLGATARIPRNAQAPDWFVWAVGPAAISGEKQLQRPDGSMLGILIDANPQDEIDEAWGEARAFLLLMLGLTVFLYGLVHFTLGRAFRSVGVISQGLTDMERGDYSRRLPHFSLPEFDLIARAFNHTASTLAKTRDENRALTQRSLAIQEEERRYLAQELHDELGQSLSAIKLMAASLRKSTGASGGEAVEAIISLCDRLFGVVRAMMRRLRPLMLDELGLVASLEDLVDYWREHNPGMQLNFHCGPGIEECAGEAKIHLFRIVQECLTNSVKHAHAKQVDIQLQPINKKAGSWIELRVQDDGRGFDPESPQSGFGLLGMRERVTSLGGEFQLHSAPDAGVRIDVRVPCSKEKV